MQQQLLIIGTVWPEPTSSAAGSRMLQLIQWFISDHWKVTFASSASESERMTDLESIGVARAHIKLNDSSFDTFMQNLAPDAVMFDRFMTEEQFGWRVAKICPNSLRILNTEDLHSLRISREQYYKEKKNFTTASLFDTTIAKREIASIYRSDLSLIISTFEMDVLINTFDIDKTLLFYIPLLYSKINEQKIETWPSFDKRKDFMTIGNFRHQPNWNAVLQLKENIWPLIKKKLPNASLHIYGAYPPPKATQLHNPKERFHIQGWTADALTVIKNAKICLAPLQFGAGIKGKLIEAMLCGTPSVTTAIGCEGIIDENQDWNGYIANDPKTFAASAVELYTNKSLWQKSQQNGIDIINTKFQKEKFTGPFLETLHQLRRNLDHHRSKNFIGAMFQFHTMRSTEYMSRWIEEKNK